MYRFDYGMGGTYVMFYANERSGDFCTNNPQPAYLPYATPRGCCTDTYNHACWALGRGPKPPNLADKGHKLEHKHFKKFGTPQQTYNIDVGPVGTPDVRRISFYQVSRPNHDNLYLGLENPTATAIDPPDGVAVDPWNNYPYGRAVTLPGFGRPFYVLLRDPT
jgi:hypothetical protein